MSRPRPAAYQGVAGAINPPGHALNTIPNGSKLKSLKYCEKQTGTM